MRITVGRLRTRSEGTTLAFLPLASGVTELRVADRPSDDQREERRVNPLLYEVVPPIPAFGLARDGEAVQNIHLFLNIEIPAK